MPLTVLITGSGKVKEPFLRDGIQEYKKRLSGYVKISLEEVPDESIPQNMSAQVKNKILDTEGENILKKIKDDDIVVLLDLKGDLWNSERLAGILKNAELSTSSRLVFVIGGTLGVSEKLIERANYRWCLSPLTFPHQMVRLIVLEQLFRACKINR
ncbi:23S rRNA (pseudouridine(1915)-N(3))-methyltransferase RlmH, partial [Methanolacinia paynteri]|uniref:23S rRNA (pseudouridine(1915)-N(3))-methyltransferase RlmH n=1 Tax=Methanolacinia paynteri TaxID=230356 RepID=UPI00064F3602